MATTLDSPRRSISCSSYQPAGLTYQLSRSSSDRRYVLESGGRPKGTPGSRLMITTRPRKPSSRRATAALPPATPPPTITIGLAPILSDIAASERVATWLVLHRHPVMGGEFALRIIRGGVGVCHIGDIGKRDTGPGVTAGRPSRITGALPTAMITAARMQGLRSSDTAAAAPFQKLLQRVEVRRHRTLDPGGHQRRNQAQQTRGA